MSHPHHHLQHVHDLVHMLPDGCDVQAVAVGVAKLAACHHYEGYNAICDGKVVATAILKMLPASNAIVHGAYDTNVHVSTCISA